MNKYVVNLLVSIVLFQAAALNAKQCPGSAQPNKNHAYLEKQFSQKGWNPCATHHARLLMPSAPTRYQPNWTLFANTANAQPNQPATSAPNKPTQVFQNEPSLPLSKYKEAENKAFWWGTGAGSAVGLPAGYGVFRLITRGARGGLGDVVIIWFGFAAGAATSVAVGGGTYAATKHYVKKHYIKEFVNETKPN